MTQEQPPLSDAVSSFDERDRADLRKIPVDRLASLWRSEVPKVVQRHEAERLEVRRALGLIS